MRPASRHVLALVAAGLALLVAPWTPACSGGSTPGAAPTSASDAAAGGAGDCCTEIAADAGSPGNVDGAVVGTGADSGTDSGAVGDPTGVLAISANAFLASLGVNTHIAQGFDATQYVTPLQYTGIRNIRDGEGNLSSMISVHQQTGVLVNIGSACDVTGQLAAGLTLADAGALLSLEGANEPNNFPITYDGGQGGGTGTWVPVAECQRDLYAGVKADPTLKAYPVFSVSEDGAETDDVGLQFLTIPSGSNIAMPDGTKYADYANPHNYVCSTQNEYVDNMAWQAADPTLNGVWDGLYVEYGVTWNEHFQGYSDADLETLPRVTTETGWDSTNNPGGQPVQGVVLVNTYLAQFKRGWAYTFIYELVDEQGSTGDQGLYTTSFTPKLSATYIHNLTTVLADTVTLATTGRLDYSIAGSPDAGASDAGESDGGVPYTVHDLLLQKSSGTFELVVWDERASGSDAVTVDLGKARPTVNLYDVTVGTTATSTLTNVSSVALTLSDHAVIVEVSE